MNNTFSPKQDDDDIFWDVQIEQEEIIVDNNHLERDIAPIQKMPSSTSFKQKTHKKNSSPSPNNWINILNKKPNKRQKNNQNNFTNKDQEQINNHLLPNLEKAKTKAIAIAITLGMLPLLFFSAGVYYFGNQAISQQETLSNEANYGALKENLKSQRKILFLFLTGTELTALLLGAISILWTQRTITRIAHTTSQTTNLAIKIENKKQSQILAKLVALVRQSISSEDILTTAVTETRKIFACDRVIIYQFDQQDANKVIAESVDPKFCEILLTYTEDLGLESKYSSEYQKKRGKVINNIYQDSQLTPEQISQYESLDIKSCLHAPIEQQGEIIGLLIAYQCANFHTWKSREIELFNQIATEIGSALNDAQMMTDCFNLQLQLQESSLWQDYLSDSIEYIHSANTEEELIKIAVEETRRVLKCDRAVFCLLDSSNQLTIVAESVDSDYPQILGTIVEETCLEREDYQESIHIVHDLETASIHPCYREQLENLEVKSLLFAPIICQNKLYGFLIAHQCSLQRFWQELESKWFNLIVKQLGYSLNNAQLMMQTRDVVKNSSSLAITNSEETAIIRSQLPVFLEESKSSLESFSQKVLAGVDAVTPIFQQMQVMAKSVEGLTNNINQTKLQSQQVDNILRVEHKNIDLTEDRLLDIQQSLRTIAIKNINLGQSCQQFIQATEQINSLSSEINQQMDETNRETSRLGIVPEKSFQELSTIISDSTTKLMSQAELIKLFLEEIKAETEQITTSLEKSEAQAFVGVEIAQETRQNLNQITTRNQEINQLIRRITFAANIGEQNSQLGQQSLLEVANLANQAAKKSLAAVNTIASLNEFLDKL